MRLPYLSDCEAEFVKKTLETGTRVDGRGLGEWRAVEVTAEGKGSGVLVGLGRTRVHCSVTPALVETGDSRGSEGSLRLSVDLSPMGAPNREPGRLGEDGVELSRTLERMVRESGMVDLESLCVERGRRAWELAVQVSVLDEDGALVDAASLAILASLLLATRPDLSLQGDVLTLDPAAAPLPVNLYHHPVAVTLGFLQDGAVTVVDPCWREERVLQGALVIAFNGRKEICAMHSSGAALLSKDLIHKASAVCLQRSLDLIQMVRSAVGKVRAQRRAEPGAGGLAHWIGGRTRKVLDAEVLAGPSQTKPLVRSDGAAAGQKASEPSVVSVSLDVARLSGRSGRGGATERLMTERSPDDPSPEDEEALVSAIRAASTRPSQAPTQTPTTTPAQTPAQPTPAKKKKRAVDAGLLDDIQADVQSMDSHGHLELDLTKALKPKIKRGKNKGKLP